MHFKFLYLFISFITFGWLVMGLVPAEVRATTQATQSGALFLEKGVAWGGQARSAFQHEDTLIVGRMGATNLYNISAITNPIELAIIPNFQAQAHKGDYLYGSTESGGSNWEIWNINQPNSPLNIGTFQPSGNLVAHSEEYLIFKDSSGTAITIYILDSPAMPQQTARWSISGETVYIGWMELVSNQLLVSLYTESCGQGSCNTFYRPIEILDLSDPTTPTTMGQGTREMSERELNTVANGYLFQADIWVSEGVLYISEIVEAPAEVRPVATLELGNFAPKAITIYSDTLYLATSEITQIFDISTPAAPVLIGTTSESIAGAVHQQYIFGLSRFYDINELLSIPYLAVFDVSTPSSPTLTTTIFHAAGDVAVQANPTTAYIFDNGYRMKDDSYRSVLHMVDTTNPTQPRLVRSDVIGDFPNNNIPTAEMKIVQDTYFYLGIEGHRIGIYRLPTKDTPPQKMGSLLATGSMHVINSDSSLVVTHRSSFGQRLKYMIFPSQRPLYLPLS